MVLNGTEIACIELPSRIEVGMMDCGSSADIPDIQGFNMIYSQMVKRTEIRKFDHFSCDSDQRAPFCSVGNFILSDSVCICRKF